MVVEDFFAGDLYRYYDFNFRINLYAGKLPRPMETCKSVIKVYLSHCFTILAKVQVATKQKKEALV